MERFLAGAPGRTRRVRAAVALPLVAAALVPARADGLTATVSLLPGPLAVTIGDVHEWPSTGGDYVNVCVHYQVIDARGSGAGWRLTAFFTSASATATPLRWTVHDLNGLPGLPTAMPTPTTLTKAQVLSAAPGDDGMGAFGGRVVLTVAPESEGDTTSGELTLVLRSGRRRSVAHVSL